MLNQFGAFIRGSDLCFTEYDNGIGLADWFPYDSPQYLKMMNPLIEQYLNISRYITSFVEIDTF